MSVEVTGPEGYDFQYLNSLLFALEYLDEDEVEVFIESENGEDAQITFIQEGIKYIIDIQVKSRSEEIDISSFSEWISHFESRSADNCLLKKLDKESNRYVVFVSNVRSRDDVSLFVSEEMINARLNVGFNDEYLGKIKKHIKNSYSCSTDLSTLRRDFLEKFMDSIKNNELRNMLKKIKLRERYTEEHSTGKIRRLLNEKFYIPQGKTDEVITELLDKIRDGRGTNISITNDLINIINKHSGEIILNRNENYIKRAEKQLCEKTLRDESVLLLTGVSFCGKSYLAKDIAQDYLENGYNVKRVGELYGDGGAISFIMHRSIEDRLLILEDPFGQVKTKEGATSILNELRNLIEDAKSNRKIIVTSRKDILFDTASKKNLDECSITSHRWIDLTLDNSEKMIELWKSYYGDSLESINIYSDIEKWLQENEKTSSIQLGQISNIHSSKKELKELASLNTADIIKIARVDSNDLAGIIERRGIKASEVFVALGLSCNTYKSVKLEDLAFIISNSEEEPGIYKDIKESQCFSLSGITEDDTNKEYPKYEFDYKLDDEYKIELKYLQQHGYIQIDKLKRSVMFVHPIYHFATQILFEKQFVDIFEQEEVIGLVEKTLSSLSINANLCTLTMLENLYKENSENELKKLMLAGLDSIFPAVRDKVVMFFGRRISNLDKSEQKKIVDMLTYSQNIDNYNICWYEGLPYFNASKKDNFSFGDWLRSETDNDNIDLILRKIDNELEVSSEEMWNLLNINNTRFIEFEALEKALSYDESFIRGKAIRLIFENYAHKFENVDRYLNIYEHPEFIYNLFRGSLVAWSSYRSNEKKKILDYFKSSLNTVSVSIRTKRFLENFEDEYFQESIDWSEIEKKDRVELWNIWHEIFIEFLDKFPFSYVNMNEPHMVRVLDHSLEYVKDEEKIIELSMAWFNWLDGYLEYNLPGDYGMSVASYLMKGTGKRSNYREHIFKKMLSTEKTSFITSNINVFIDCWDDLSDKEKRIILDIHESERKDIKWIKATSLNRKIIPEDVQKSILGETIDKKSISDIVNILDQKGLLEQCLNIHCGYPHPLWWNGYHHNSYNLWDAVILEVLKRDELNRAFDIALRETIDLLYNDDNRRMKSKYDVYEQELLKTSTKRKLVFEKLLYVTATQNQCNKKLWDLLIQYSSKEEIKYYFDRVAEDIELVQYHQIGEGELFALFDKSVVFEEIYPRLKEDNLIKDSVDMILCSYEFSKETKDDFESFRDKNLGEIIKKANEEEILNQNNRIEKFKETFTLCIDAIYRMRPPRLLYTNRIVEFAMGKLDISSSELKDIIEKNRIRLLEATNDLRQKYDDHYELIDWIR